MYRLILIFLLASMSNAAEAKNTLYKCTAKNGQTVFTYEPTKEMTNCAEAGQSKKSNVTQQKPVEAVQLPVPVVTFPSEAEAREIQSRFPGTVETAEYIVQNELVLICTVVQTAAPPNVEVRTDQDIWKVTVQKTTIKTNRNSFLLLVFYRHNGSFAHVFPHPTVSDTSVRVSLDIEGRTSPLQGIRLEEVSINRLTGRITMSERMNVQMQSGVRLAGYNNYSGNCEKYQDAMSKQRF